MTRQVRHAAGAPILTFLGTRGETDIRSRRHQRHSALLIPRGAARVMIDCGTDWRGLLDKVAPTAIVLTHAHPDHASGLVDGAPCLIDRYPIERRRQLPLRKPVIIKCARFEAFPVNHSIRAPTVGHRVRTNDVCFVYVPDVARIPDTPQNAPRGHACWDQPMWARDLTDRIRHEYFKQATATDATNAVGTERWHAIMSEKAQTVQDVFLNYLRNNKTPVTLFLMNGIKLQGTVAWFDNFSMVLRRDGHSQLVYKSTISTIMPLAPVPLFDGERSPQQAKAPNATAGCQRSMRSYGGRSLR